MKGNLVIYHTCGRCGEETTKSIFMPFGQTITLPTRLECGKCEAKVNYCRLQNDVYEETRRQGKASRLSHQLSFECPHCGRWSKCTNHKIGVDDLTGFDILRVPENIGCQICEEAVSIPKSEGGSDADDY